MFRFRKIENLSPSPAASSSAYTFEQALNHSLSGSVGAKGSRKPHRLLSLQKILMTSLACYTANAVASDTIRDAVIESDVEITGQIFADTNVLSPSALIDERDMESINVATVEDVLSYAPNLIVRRRYIGDPNGVIGVRGSNMFQSARTSVYLDGMPIHYHLQTRFSGSPRWSLAPAPELGSTEVLYGPYSARYSGNAMGGVVNLASKAIESNKTRAQFSLYSQEYDQLATSERYNGTRVYLSHENRFGDLGIRFGYQHLQNDSQPMTQFLTSDTQSFNEEAMGAQGAIPGRDARGREAIYFGDSGATHADTDLFTIKSDYQLAALNLRSHIAFEQRDRQQDNPNNFLLDEAGNPVWFGGSNFQHRIQERNSLLASIGASMELGAHWKADGFLSYFDILKDRETRSGRDPRDPDFVSRNESFGGRLTEFSDTGWVILEAKTGTHQFAGRKDLRLSIGLHADQYKLGLRSYNYNSIASIRGNLRDNNEGQSETAAVFAQFGWQIKSDWDIALGLRLEHWSAEGVVSGAEDAPSSDQNDTASSPKFSIAHTPNDMSEIRYSVARAVRFPIVEELYRNESRLPQDSGSQFLGDPSLRPEKGIFHNLSYSFERDNLTLRANLFYDEVDDTIFNSSTVVGSQDGSQSSITTALPVSEVKTSGAELSFDWRNIQTTPLSINAHVSYTDSSVNKNRLDTSIEGRQFPRIPYWRGNVTTRYDFSSAVFTSLGLRYASNSFGRLDNQDTQSSVFGAHDEYVFVNLKSAWQLNQRFKVALGIDNLFDKEAYVFHPWPSRSYSFSLSAEL